MRRAFFIGLLALSVAAPAAGDSPPAGKASASVVPDLPLEELPTMPLATLPAPTPAAVQALEGRLEQLTNLRGTQPVEPKLDFGFLLGELDDDLVPAIAQRLEQLRHSIDGRGAVLLLERARKAGVKALNSGKKQPQRAKTSAAGKAAPDTATAVDGDWLQFAVALQKHEERAWRELVELYGMLRMLEALGTTPCVREMLTAYGYFGELVRIDLQRAIERLGDKAVPALIEAREHDARKVREWSRHELEAIGRAIPGEAVSTNDLNVLAEVLMAFGRVRDVDAARVILSFVASDRIQLKKAARQAIVAIGEPAIWHLRDAYETATGEKAARNWDHKRLTQELFRLQDRARMTVVLALMEKGLDLAKKNEVPASVEAFDQLLARSPLFERRKEMAPTYSAFAAELEKANRLAEALVVYRKALRLDPATHDVALLESRIAGLEGRILVERGTPDPFILKRAIELDPNNRTARELLAVLENPTTQVEHRTRRVFYAAGATLVALLAMTALLRRRRSPEKSVGVDSARPLSPPQRTPSSDPPEQASSLSEPQTETASALDPPVEEHPRS